MIKLFTDTTANLTRELVERYDIGLVSLSYTLDGRETACGAGPDFNGREFYEAMRNGAEAKTSMASVSSFVDAFEPYVKNGDSVIFFGISSGISGTVHSAELAAEELTEKYHSAKLAVIDTLAAGLGEGFQVLEAAELIEKGEPFLKIVKRCELRRKNMCQFFTVDDLKYLRKGGRISAATAAVGTVLNIKPILIGSDDGHIVSCGKVRGSMKSLIAIANKYDELVLDKSARVGITHADNPAAAETLENLVRERGFNGEFIVADFEPVCGSHVGPGSVALFFMGEHK
ncbi:MAG: DegV family protein [Oscillospiraceae bacterium]